MRRKRGNRGTWFPILPNQVVENQFITFDTKFMDAAIDYSPNVVATPWLHDQTMDEQGSNNDVSLRDLVEGQNCQIQRIVGKIFWCCAQEAPESGDGDESPSLALACSALAILPVANDVTQQGFPELSPEEFDPLDPRNMDKPWIWRRTWLLGNAGNAAVSTLNPYTAPSSNAFYGGGVLDGPHVDAKTRRYINKDERLWLIHSVRQQASQGDPNPLDILHLQVTADLRVFGKMVKGRTKRNFS